MRDIRMRDPHARYAHTAHKHASRSDRKLPVKQSFARSTNGTCLACKKRDHHTVDRISVVRALRLCINCLRRWHMEEKCRACLKCKICTKHHHMGCGQFITDEAIERWRQRENSCSGYKCKRTDATNDVQNEGHRSWCWVYSTISRTTCTASTSTTSARNCRNQYPYKRLRKVPDICMA